MVECFGAQPRTGGDGVEPERAQLGQPVLPVVGVDSKVVNAANALSCVATHRMLDYYGPAADDLQRLLVAKKESVIVNE